MLLKTKMRLLSFIATIVATGTLIHSKESTGTYIVRRITERPVLSGDGSDARWKSAAALTDFQYPWEKENPRPTSFKALHDDQWVYCLFEVEDPAVHIQIDNNDKSEVAESSRAEIFFKADDNMNPYYCLEIDPKGRVLDYEAFYHRRFNFNWTWPKDQLVIKTEQRKDGYSIEVAISKKSLMELGLLKNNTLQAGIFRADCIVVPGGDTPFKWISWVKPDAAKPDFHIPSSFGLLRLE